MNILRSLFDHEYKELKKFRSIADKIELLKDEYSNLSKEDLKNKTTEFKYFPKAAPVRHWRKSVRAHVGEKFSPCAVTKGAADRDPRSIGQHKLIFFHGVDVFVVDPIALVAADKSAFRHVFQQFGRRRGHHFCAITRPNPCLVQDPLQIENIPKQNAFD